MRVVVVVVVVSEAPAGVAAGPLAGVLARSRGWRLTALPRGSPADGARSRNSVAAASGSGAAASHAPAPELPGPAEHPPPSIISAEFRDTAQSTSRPEQREGQPPQPKPHAQQQQQPVNQEPAPERAREQQQQQQQLRHGPGLCACCRPVGGTGEGPVTQIITYIDGVVLEVETADGDVVYLDDQEGEGEEGGEAGGVVGAGEVRADGTYTAGRGPEPAAAAAAGRSGGGLGGGGGPLVFVPDLVIPPSSPAAAGADFWRQ
ncbi:hypothetical protein PLESTF_000085200 [Pleodorina starrii]|nr:hypothetical protein PLESTF_000085200 [Pleodorina starrii]